LEVGGVSHRLAEFACYQANRLSFQELWKLLVDRLGITQLSARTLHRVVERVATDVATADFKSIAAASEVVMPDLAARIDLYDPKSEEVVVMEDGILVKAQKPESVRPNRFIPTNMATLQLPDGSYQTVMESLTRDATQSFTLAQALHAAFVTAWGKTTQEELAVVALTDGASCIRTHLAEVFGERVAIVLDWYHLMKKLKEKLSQICYGSAHRKEVKQAMASWLWRGDVESALTELEYFEPRKPEVLASLQGYLTKHREEIIDYERRQAAGKPIGSGRMEKAVDLAIGHRQKRKGMSWLEKGSRTLACLRCVELNGQWEIFWQRRAA